MGVKLSYASRVVLVDSEHIAIEESAILSAPFEISAALDFRVKSTHPETRKSTKKTSEIADVAVFRHPNSGPIESIGRRKPGTGTSPIQQETNCWLPEFLAQSTDDAMTWLIEPILPRGGTILLHGPTSVGKSPFSWALATTVSEGGDFFGHPVCETGPVLYIELDTPANLIHPRLVKLKRVGQRVFLAVFAKGLDILKPRDEDNERLQALNEKVRPVLVIVNTLRKSHTEDDKDSGVPFQVYTAWQTTFPGATLLVVHHDKKDVVTRGKQNADQAFSGSGHWANDATIAFHLTRTGRASKKADDEGKDYEKSRVTLKMTKSQVCDHEHFESLVLQLDTDGTNWVETGPAAYRAAFKALPSNTTRTERIKVVMKRFHIGKTAVYDAVEGLK